MQCWHPMNDPSYTFVAFEPAIPHDGPYGSPPPIYSKICGSASEAVQIARDFDDWEIWMGNDEEQFANLLDTSGDAMERYHNLVTQEEA